MDKTLAIFSLEMGADLVDRMLAAERAVESVIRTGQLTDEEWRKYAIAQGNLASAVFTSMILRIRITEIVSRAEN